MASPSVTQTTSSSQERAGNRSRCASSCSERLPRLVSPRTQRSRVTRRRAIDVEHVAISASRLWEFRLSDRPIGRATQEPVTGTAWLRLTDSVSDSEQSSTRVTNRPADS